MIATEMFLNELNEEAVTTRKFIADVPMDKAEWQPHPKCLTLKALATHIAELPIWITYALTTEELDFATNHHQPAAVNSLPELQELFETSLANGRSHLTPDNESKMNDPWTLRSGDTVYSTMTKAETIRRIFNQIIHHRAQLAIYFHMLNIPVPPTYGTRADYAGA